MVDLPGYGYAAVPGRVKSSFAPMVENYLEERDNLIGILHVLDARHAPTKLDFADAGIFVGTCFADHHVGYQMG